MLQINRIAGFEWNARALFRAFFDASPGHSKYAISNTARTNVYFYTKFLFKTIK